MLTKRLIESDSTSGALNAGLLILRVGAGLSVFLKHGVEKLTGYSTMVQHFPDPIHIGAHASLAYALVADGICSLLVAVGLVTRPSAFLGLINLLTAFFLVHHAAFFGKDHGAELVWVYITIYTALIFTGPGRFSIDRLLSARRLQQGTARGVEGGAKAFAR
jgi:putative oxidoreductase